MLYDRPLGETLTSAELSEEVIRTLVGSIGLVLAIPVTTLIAVLVVKATGINAGAAAVEAPAMAVAGGSQPRGASAQDASALHAGTGHNLDDVADTGALAAAALEGRARRVAAQPGAAAGAGAGEGPGAAQRLDSVDGQEGAPLTRRGRRAAADRERP
jgi:hypothetical protein